MPVNKRREERLAAFKEGYQEASSVHRAMRRAGVDIAEHIRSSVKWLETEIYSIYWRSFYNSTERAFMRGELRYWESVTE